MSKLLKISRAIAFSWLILANLTSLASKQKDSSEINYYEEEGKILFRLRVYGVKTSSKQKGLPLSTSSAPIPIGTLLENGFGADGSASIFFTDNIAAELSVGVNVLKVKSSTISNIANNYNGGTIYGKRRDLYMMPVAVTGQYHVAPFGAIRPYLGVGYHGAYNFTRLKEFKISNGHGGVFQLGTDFIANDDTTVNFDIRQFLLKTKISYKSNVTGSKNVSSKMKINPLIISVGVGFAL
ncbi:MAG: OmpW family outer membrane protein [Janthinobacterium lividum]